MASNDLRLRVSVDQSVCVGAGLCVLSTSEIFDQRDEDGVVTLLQDMAPEALREAVLGAVRKCPSSAISVEEVTMGPEQP
jgi:ferredoxin